MVYVIRKGGKLRWTILQFIHRVLKKYFIVVSSLKSNLKGGFKNAQK